jgi:hypothetical protein
MFVSGKTTVELREMLLKAKIESEKTAIRTEIAKRHLPPCMRKDNEGLRNSS